MAAGASCLQVVRGVIVTALAVVNFGCLRSASDVSQLTDVTIPSEDRASEREPVLRQPFLTVASRPVHLLSLYIRGHLGGVPVNGRPRSRPYISS